MSDAMLLTLPLAILAVAAAADCAARRIPNAVTVALAVTAFFRCAHHGAGRAALAIVVALALTCVLCFLWKASVLGGGDVKLMAASSMLISIDRLHVYLAAIAIGGGFVAVLSVIAGKQMRSSGRGAQAASGTVPIGSSGSRVSVPYGVAISLGTLVALTWS